MKLRIKKNKKGGLLADYPSIADKKAFRFCFFTKLLDDFGHDAAFYIDTNQRAVQSVADGTLTCFEREGFSPLRVRVHANSQSFFGFNVKSFNKNTVEYIIVADIKGRELSRTLFDALSPFDIGIGIGQKKPVSNSEGQLSLEGVAAFRSCFTDFCYDSIVCARINSTFDISHYIEEAINEMGA